MVRAEQEFFSSLGGGEFLSPSITHVSVGLLITGVHELGTVCGQGTLKTLWKLYVDFGQIYALTT